MRTRPASLPRLAARRPSRLALLGAAGVLAACAPDRVAAPLDGTATTRPSAVVAALTTETVLYDQSPAGSWPMTVAPGFGDTPLRIAVDFVVPAGTTWSVSQVLLPGFLWTPTLSFSLRADGGARPGTVLHSFTLAPARSADSPCCDGSATDYLFTLPAPITLAPGTYWLAVEMGGNGAYYFYWQLRQPVAGALSHQSRDGVTWAAGLPTYDLGFVVYGSSRTRQAQTITFAPALPSAAVVGVSYAVDASASSGLVVAVGAGPAGVCTLSGGTLTLLGVGTCTVTADQAGDLDHAPAQVTHPMAVDYGFAGFAAPVRNDGALNTVKAGKAVALKWRLTDASGAPVTTLATAALTAAHLECSVGGTPSQVREYAAGASGLQHLGGGYYQLNWKAPTSYAGSCKTLRLGLGEGSGPRTALFEFAR